MLLLAIETSGMDGSLALLRDGQLLGERHLDRQGRHARTLVSEVRELLREHHIEPCDCGYLAVSMGPGSFTGLRVGITFAKTFAYATGAKLIGVETFDALAAGVSVTTTRLHVVMNAQREELFLGEYEIPEPGRFRQSNALRIVKVEQWLAELSPDVLVTGPGLEGCHDRITNRASCSPRDEWYPQAAIIGRVAASMSDRADLPNCWDFEPLYVRKSAAEEKWDATVGKG